MKQKLLLFLVSMLCMVTTALAQTKVTGTVLSQEDGEPVIGATVMIQGDKKGTVTGIAICDLKLKKGKAKVTMQPNGGFVAY